MSDAQWKIIKPLLPPPNTVGRPREADLRRVVNGIFYVTKTGTQWRHLPPCYGPWQTCYRYYRQFIDAGVWNKVTRRCEPRFGVVLNARTYRQLARLTVKTSRVRPCLRRGYDAGKKINGIKRHILVDTMGMLMVVLVTTAWCRTGMAPGYCWD